MTYRDEFDDPPHESGVFAFLGNIGPRAVFFILLIALSFMVGVVWKLYLSKGAQQNVGGMIPVIRADKKEFKAVPEDPGGMEIAHRDSTIFDVFKGDKKTDKVRVENLFAEDENEEPIPRSQLFAGLNTQDQEIQERQAQEKEIPENQVQKNMVQENLAVVPEQIAPRVEEIDLPAQDSETQISSVSKVVKAAEEVKTEEVKAPVQKEGEIPVKVEPPKTEPKTQQPKKAESFVMDVKPQQKPVPKAAFTQEKPKQEKPKQVTPKVEAQKLEPQAPVVSDGAQYYVQLGSVKSADGAQIEWKKLQKKYEGPLAGFSHRVQKVELGEKGTFYRIQVGPVSKDQANRVCSDIKKITPGGCLVKK